MLFSIEIGTLGLVSDCTLPSSEPDAIRSSLKGFLGVLAFWIGLNMK